MNGSPSAIVSLGFGSWGSVNLIVTLGFGVGAGDIHLGGGGPVILGYYQPLIVMGQFPLSTDY